MKKAPLTIAVPITLMMFCGCVTTSFTTPSGIEFNRRAFLYPFRTGGFEFDPNTGFITVLDYNTDGGKGIAGAVTAAAIETAFKARGL